MSEAERQAKMQELMTLIAEKEKELSQLETERSQLVSQSQYNATYESSGQAWEGVSSNFWLDENGVPTLGINKLMGKF